MSVWNDKDYRFCPNCKKGTAWYPEHDNQKRCYECGLSEERAVKMDPNYND